MIIAMYSAVAGMSAHQTKLNVIGNNIANVNTNGFKSSRMTFSDVFYQNLQNASAPTANSGGMNSNQLGYGSKVGSIDVVNTIAGGADTGRALDVYINGEGYLPVKGTDGNIKYTRVGNLKFDTAGNLTDANGNMVLGIPKREENDLPTLEADGTTKVQNLQAITIAPAELEKYLGISIGTTGEITGIKEGDPDFTNATGTGWLESAVIDPGSYYNGTVKMSTVPGNDVSFTEPVPAVTGISAGGVIVPPLANILGSLTMTKTGTDYILSGKDKSGKDVAITGTRTGDIVTFPVPDAIIPPATTSAASLNLEVTVDSSIEDKKQVIGSVGADSMTITSSVYDEGGTLQILATTTDWIKGKATVTLGDITFTVDPAKFGALGTASDVTIGKVGPGNGTPKTLGYLAVAKFANADGLTLDGDGYTLQSANSGEASVSIAGTKGTGNLRTSALEMSNVDLAREFTDMIVAQRGFQANTRMITVSDSILEELINLKR